MVGGSFQLTIIGFEHTAFIFSHESMIDQVKVEDDQVKPGALISLLQKSLQYMELEAHVNDVMKFETVAHSVRMARKWIALLRFLCLRRMCVFLESENWVS